MNSFKKKLFLINQYYLRVNINFKISECWEKKINKIFSKGIWKINWNVLFTVRNNWKDSICQENVLAESTGRQLYTLRLQFSYLNFRSSLPLDLHAWRTLSHQFKYHRLYFLGLSLEQLDLSYFFDFTRSIQCLLEFFLHI